MKKSSILLIFVLAVVVLVGTAASLGLFSHKKLINREIRAEGNWKEKRVFVDACVKDSTITVQSDNDPNRPLQICSCLAEKVESKHPEGMTYQEAKKEYAFNNADAQFCYK